VAEAVVAAVSLPRGTQATTVELQPEAPIQKPTVQEDPR